MEWIEKLNEAITYMEEHLTEEIRCGELAKIACCSAYLSFSENVCLHGRCSSL